MDQSFNQTGGQGHPSSSAKPTNAYQTNVNRTKTRKWVEAKVQSYSGDDWGSADEDDSDNDSVGPEPPLQLGSNQDTRASPYIAEASRAQAPPAAVPAPAASTAAASSDPVAQQSAPVAADAPTPTAPTTAATPIPGPTAAPTGAIPAQEPEKAPDADEDDDRRASISPQLPNVNRMSAFGFDLFPGASGGPDAGAPQTAVEHTIQEERGHSPAPLSVASTTGDANRGALSGSPAPPPGAQQAFSPPHLSPQPRPGEHDISSLSEQDDAASKDISLGSRRVSAHDAAPGLALRIDSPPPNVSASSAQDMQQPTTATTAADTPVSILPTEPLQPRKPDHSPSDYEPLPLHHTLTQNTQTNTATSSPVKESDVLSEEIMRSLTPGSNTGAGTGAPGLKPQESSTSLATGSWERSGGSSDISGSYEQHEAVAVPVLSIPAQQTSLGPAQPQQPITVTSSEDASTRDLRNRFSWEALADPQSTRAAVSPPVVSPPVTSPTVAPVVSPPVTSMVSPPPQSVQQPLGSVQRSEGGWDSPRTESVTSPISPTIKIVSESQPLDQQVRPLSPVDAASAGPAPPKQLDVSEARPPAGPSHDAPPSSAPHSSAGPGAGTSTNEKPVMPFKDIMALPSAEERIERYEESRSSFATSESGLDDWIATMKQQHPDHANASGSFSGSMAPARTPSPSGSHLGGGPPGQPGQPGQQQPYYQQYLNASSSSNIHPSQGAPTTSTARSRLAGLQEHAHAAAGSAFGHSGGQIGNKGKEFMQSAGKMGKGLFSKGKSKLRGTGDKVFH